MFCSHSAITGITTFFNHLLVIRIKECLDELRVINYGFLMYSSPCRVLILHLKRYSFNAQLSLNSKLGQQVVIPRYLTLLSHCTETTRPPVSLGWSSQASM